MPLKQEERDVLSLLHSKAQEKSAKSLSNTSLLAAGREQLFFEQLSEKLKQVFKDKLPVPSVPKKRVKKADVERILHVAISDTHYGAALDPREVGAAYGPIEEIRRTAEIARQVADYKRHYRDKTKLYVHLLGDLFQGQLHDPRDGEPLAQQVCQTIYVLTRLLRYLSAEFPAGVTVFCTTGNHGRHARHKTRAIHQKWDSVETIVHFALKTALSNIKNVEFKLNYAPFYEFQVFGNLGLGTHGDTFFKTGYPSQTVNVAAMKKQIADLNHSRILKGLQPYKMVVTGHVHTGSMTHAAKNCVILTNGPLVPADPFALACGVTDTSCGQWLWESVPEHIKGDSRFVEVDEATDADESLDSILGAPFSGIDR